ncbi:hypothetical protein D1007_47572 [Hordeum vulgare]|nr:hypothetical protein D1007_47572 [Hordeum vulgare]
MRAGATADRKKGSGKIWGGWMAGSSGAACDSGDTRWRVSFAADLGARRLSFVGRRRARLPGGPAGRSRPWCSRSWRHAGRGGDRGGDRSKFSWKRDDDNRNNSSASNVAFGSTMGKQTAEGGVWIPKRQGSFESAGDGVGRQISPPPRRTLGKQSSQGVMEVAWVKISNAPLDKRSEINLAYVASLVGIPLEIDTATLHRPASARVKIGCRNIDDFPSVAESVFDGHFYDFYFEVDQVLVRDPNREENNTKAVRSKDKKKKLDDNDNDMSKKPKLDG